jgi:hypothetical protein
MPQPQPPPQKHPEMSEEAWQDHLEEVRAFERRNYRQSGGRGLAKPSQENTGQTVQQAAKERELFARLRTVKQYPIAPDGPPGDGDR